MITTLALESNPNLDQFAKMLEGAKERFKEKTRELEQRERDIKFHEALNAQSNEDNKEELKRLREEEEELKSLRDQIDECETAEARDRIRLAERFAESVERRGGVTNGYERTAYTKSLSMILGSISPNNCPLDRL